MRRHRTTARALLLLLAVGAFSGTASAAAPRLAFPVVGNVTFTDDFGAPRWQGRHEGNDLMGVRWQPVIAVERGTVQKHVGSGMGTCMLYLHGRSGLTYVYIHLNNDRTKRNDNTGGCRNGISWAPGLRSGDKVARGQLVGYLGDSGDADGIQPHLHFEMRRAGGRALNPYRHLTRARRALYPRPAGGAALSLALKKARVVSVTEETIRIRTRRIKMSNGWSFVFRRKVTVAVPADGLVERKTESGPAPGALADAEAGEAVRVWTESFTPTWRTQRARPGVLSVRRVYLGRN